MEQIYPNQTMSSREIARITGKNHRDIMRSIRNMEPAWEKINGRKFALVDYFDSKGEKRPMYDLTKTECLYIATKFNDEARAKLILRWEKLEIEKQRLTVLPSYQIADPILRAEIWIEEQKQAKARIEIKTREIEKLAPKAELMQRVIEAGQLIDIGQVAKILQLEYGRNKLFKILKEKGILFKAYGRNEPKQEYINRGYFKLKEILIQRENHKDIVVMKTLVTHRGLEFLARILGINNIRQLTMTTIK